MHPLYQRLKELDPDTFQRLCGQLLMARYPSLPIRPVDGPGGDEGLDVFLGELEGRPTVWQCKSFPNGFGTRQRKQVTHSLTTVLAHFTPLQWILMIPIDLDSKGHRWFQKKQVEYASHVQLGLYQASDIFRELMYRREIRETFFPLSVVDSVSLRRALKELGSASRAELIQAASESLDELSARLEEADARFSFRFAYAPSGDPGSDALVPLSPTHLASITHGDSRIDVFARDIEALHADPPKLALQVGPSGEVKLQDFLRTGKPQELVSTDIASVKSTFDFLFPSQNVEGISLRFQSSMTDTLKFRFTITGAKGTVSYEFLEFALTRAGTDEAQIRSVSKVPFVFCFTFPRQPNAEGCFEMIERIEGAEVKAVAKAFRAFEILCDGGSATLYDLERECEFHTISGPSASPDRGKKFDKLLHQAARISEEFRIELFVRKTINEDEERMIVLLSHILDGTPLPGKRCAFQLQKVGADADRVLAQLAAPFQLMITQKEWLPVPMIFGTTVPTGPIRLQIDQATLVQPEQFRASYLAAAENETVRVEIEAVKIFFVRGGPSNSDSPLVSPA